MGLKDMRANAIAEKEAKEEAKEARRERDANPDQVWEYKAFNLVKSFGPTLEGDFNKLGAQGWEFCTVVSDKGREGYAIFKRPVA